jgi:hypothetical protein
MTFSRRLNVRDRYAARLTDTGPDAFCSLQQLIRPELARGYTLVHNSSATAKTADLFAALV